MKKILLLAAIMTICVGRVTFANPIPLPADPVWTFELHSDPTTNYIIWNDNRFTYVLLGLHDRVVLARNGEVVQTSDPFNGEVTALLRADVMDEERPEFLVAVKEDSLNLIHILDGEDFSNLQTIVTGWDWIISNGDPDSMWRESYEEKTIALHWVGGEEGVLMIGKETYRENSSNFGGGLSRDGQILRYSIPNDTLLSAIPSGYDQNWSVVDGDFMVGSSSWWANFEPIFYGFNQFIAQRFSSDFSGLQTKTMGVGDFEGYQEIHTALTAIATVRMPDESVCMVASVDSRYAYREPSTTLRIFDATNFDSLTSFDLNRRYIESFVTIQNQEGDHLQPYLMCIGELARTRLLSTSTLSLTARGYVSPFSGIGVRGYDCDMDGQNEIIGWGGPGLICVRLRQLSAPPEAGAVSATNFALLNCYPNPFNSSTTISYSLPAPGRYAIDVVDLQGRLVTRLSDGWKEAGSYREVFEGGQINSGTYYLNLRLGNESQIKPILLVK